MFRAFIFTRLSFARDARDTECDSNEKRKSSKTKHEEMSHAEEAENGNDITRKALEN